MKHICNKEVDIELIKQNSEYTKEKLGEIHKILVGNGKPGLVREMNEIQGMLRYTQIIASIAVALIAIMGFYW